MTQRQLGREEGGAVPKALPAGSPENGGRLAPTRRRANSLRGDAEAATSSYPPIEAARRTLQVLRVLNEMGPTSVSALGRATGIARPTVVRTLETLIAEGYVARDNFLGGYRITSQVRLLSAGFDAAPLIIEASRSHTIELTRQVKWPVSIGIRAGDGMEVCFTTSSISPWSFPFCNLNQRLSLFSTAMGRCYLAFASNAERTELLSALRARRAAGAIQFDDDRIEADMSEVRSAGFAVQEQFPQIPRPTRFGFASMPIVAGRRCVGCLGVGFYTTAVPTRTVPRALIPAMKEAVAGIEGEISRLKRSHRRTGPAAVGSTGQ